MLIVHDACKTTRADGNDEVQSDFTSNAFESYTKQGENVSILALTAVSACATIHRRAWSFGGGNDVFRLHRKYIPFYNAAGCLCG
ncbi:hypothetical protein M0R45_036825 [Rubus argutus]|uniref:Uncharacterized protein n=1 Tax=Rubus argutus TaxID=59490 RepID=A0AAW1W2C8_RUBAR